MSSYPPHVHILGDLSELLIVRKLQTLPDHESPADVAAFRKLHGVVKRTMAGGAWSLSQFVRAALRDIWRIDTVQHLDGEWGFNEGNESRGEIEGYSWATFLESTDSEFGDFAAFRSCVENWHRSANGKINANYAVDTPWSATAEVFLARPGDASSTSDVVPITYEGKAAGSADPGFAALYHDFGEGLVSCCPMPHDNKSVRMRVEVGGEWSPSLAIWPVHPTVRLAVRFIDFNELLESPGQIDFQEQDFQKVVDRLQSPKLAQVWTPLLDFLQIDEKPLQQSRGVFLVSKKWNGKSSPDPVGYFLFEPGKGAWQVWATRCQATQDVGELNESDIISDRVAFRSPKENGLGFFAIPVSGELVRLFQPQRRPIADVLGPLAVVTTVQPMTNDGFDNSTVVRPIWYIRNDRLGSTYRLDTQEGYDFPPNWILEVKKRRENWKKRQQPESVEKEYFDSPEQALTRAIEWGLSRYHIHGKFVPQWIPKNAPLSPQYLDLPLSCNHEFQHLAIMDLNFGFRRHPDADNSEFHKQSIETTFCKDFCNFINIHKGSIRSFASSTIDGTDSKPFLSHWPDWWLPLIKWWQHRCISNISGWIVATFERQLPFSENEVDTWDKGDLWDLLGNATWNPSPCTANIISGSTKQGDPMFHDRTIVVLSGQLLRASGARISHRLSWEHTAHDCVQELTNNPRFEPLLKYRHLIVRFGCTAAIHFSASCKPTSLYYDATAKGGFYRKPATEGRVIGSNAVFVARILQALLGAPKAPEGEVISKGIRQALVDCQALFNSGYGKDFKEDDAYRMNSDHIYDTLFQHQEIY